MCALVACPVPSMTGPRLMRVARLAQNSYPGSYYSADVISRSNGRMNLRFDHLYDSSVQREAEVEEIETRPVPPASPEDWLTALKDGDPLEVYHNEGW